MKKYVKIRYNKKEIEKIRNEFKKTIATLLVSSFSFVAALLWRDAIQESLKPIIEAGGNAIIFKYYVALLVSAITVIVTFLITKYVYPVEKR